MKKIFDKLVLILLILNPVIDVITYFQINNNSSFLSASVILRSLILILTFLYLVIHKSERKFLIFFILYIIIDMGLNLFRGDSFINEAYGLSIIFYYIVLGHFFSKYKNDLISGNMAGTRLR